MTTDKDFEAVWRDSKMWGEAPDALSRIEELVAENERLRMTQGGMEFTARLSRYEKALRAISNGTNVTDVHIARAALTPEEKP